MATARLDRKLRGSANFLVILLGLAVFLNYIDRGAIAVAAPLMKGELGLSATQFGTAVSAFFWIYAPVQFVVGWLCDRFSVYRLIALGVIVWAASTLAMGFVGGFLSLAVLRVMLGVGESIIFPGSSKIIALHVPPEQRGMANAWCSAGLSLGPAAGTLAGGLILASLGWRAIFIAFGLLTLVWLLPWARAVSALPRAPQDEERRSISIGKLLTHWSLWSSGLGHATTNFGFYFLLAFTPLYLVQQRGLSIPEMTLLTTLGYVAQAVASLLIGAWSDRWTQSGRSEAAIRRVLLCAGQLIMGVALIAIPIVESTLAVGLLLVLAGIGTACFPTNLYAVAQMFAGPRAAGTWVGIQNGLGNIPSGIVGPIVFGMLIDRYGFGSAFYLAAAVAAFGAIWWAICVPAIKRIELDRVHFGTAGNQPVDK